MKSIITQAERDQLANLIGQIETKTAGELVVVVYSKSSNYALCRLVWAFTVALGTVGAIHWRWQSLPFFELLGAQILMIGVAFWLFGIPTLLRYVVPRWAREQAVRDKVRLLFLELGVTETRDRSGVLVYLSELERRVEILGDRGIYQHLGQEAWTQLVRELTSAIRGGHTAQGLTELVQRLGNELIASFPVRADDTNELPNAVITDRS